MVEHKVGADMIEDLYGVLASVETAEDCRGTFGGPLHTEGDRADGAAYPRGAFAQSGQDL